MAISFSSTFIAGRYTAIWGAGSAGSNALGVTEDGFELEKTIFGEEMVGDNLADTVQDIVYRGGNVFINVVLSEWSPGGILLLKNFALGLEDVGTDDMGSLVGNVGFQYAAMGATTPTNKLVLTSTADTTAASSPASLTAELANLAPGFSSRINLNNRHRKIPLRFQLLPYIPDLGGEEDPCWYTTT